MVSLERSREGDIEVVRIGPLGPYGNNAYVVRDAAARRAILVDLPAEGERILETLSDDQVEAIVVTHWHPDHWASYDLVHRRLGAPVAVHEGEVNVPPERIDRRLCDGDELSAGAARLRVIHTPGHTPGSITIAVGKVLITGDTLFQGGPGRTTRPEHLRMEIASIRDRLLSLPDDALVWPGHGDGTTVGDARREYAVFASREHPADLCRDVTWLEG